MTQIPKIDQKILNELFPGHTVKTALQTPTKELRGYVLIEDATSKEKGAFISTLSCKGQVSQSVTKIATAKAWNLSIYTKRAHLVCLLYP